MTAPTGARRRSRARERAALERLAPPRRHVPFSLRVALLLGNPYAQFAWAFFGVTLSLAMIFVDDADLTSWALLRHPARGKGVALSCADTGARIGGKRSGKTDPATIVYANRFRYEAGGGTRTGMSYSTGFCAKPGTGVEVEYAPDDPSVARISGMRAAKFGAGVLFSLFIPGVGLVIVGIVTALALRTTRYLARGELVGGKLLGSQETRVEVGGRRIMAMQFEIEHRGVLRRVVARTRIPEALDDDEREPLLFDPGRPARAQAWDVLPPVVSLDASGALRPVPFARSLLFLLPAALGVGLVLARLLG